MIPLINTQALAYREVNAPIHLFHRQTKYVNSIDRRSEEKEGRMVVATLRPR